MKAVSEGRSEKPWRHRLPADSPAGVSGGFSPGRRQRDPRGLVLAMLVLTLVNLVLASPSLDNGFSLDDYNWLERARFTDKAGDFLLAPEPGQILNPVGRGLFLSLHAAAAEDPLPYRLVVLLLHVANALLVFVLVRRLVGSPGAAFLAALLFSFQTSYDEALFWIAAFFHPLNAFFCLGALVAYLAFLESRDRRALAVSLLCFAAGLLTKAPTFALLAVLPFAPSAGRRRLSAPALLRLLPFLLLWTVAAAVNGVSGLGDSYLLERGFYRFGSHMATNLLDYLGWMLLPFDALAGRLGLAAPLVAVSLPLGLVGAAGLGWALARGTAYLRFGAILTLATLAPFLPFTLEPVSRYTYLPAAGLATVLALVVVTAWRRLAGFRWSGAVGALVLVGCFALSYVDGRLEDNHYEYRERQMSTWVDDVQAALPRVPADGKITVVGLPALAIDPGIHFEAALRLAYDEPRLRLELPAAGQAAPPGALFYGDGRIRSW